MKRQRTDAGFVRGNQDQTKAYWATRRFSNLYPWSSHGAQRVQRGSDYTLSNFGKSWNEANEIQRANRMFSGYTGKGSYGRTAYAGSGKYKLGRVGKHIQSRLKKAKVGQKVIKFAKKNQLGKRAADAALMAAYAGMGSYKGRGTYTSNVLMAGGRPGLSSRTGSVDNQEIVITHKEYLQDVFGPSQSGFTNQLIPINPGLTESFPFLSQIAANYEEYELEQLVFEFHSTVDAGNATNGATGTIIMATNYNPDQAGFVSKEAMMQYHGGVSGRITEDVVHGVECDPRKNAGSHQKFVRTNGLSNQQLKDFDLGNFQFGIVNIPTGFKNSQIGELWVHYKVRLSKPRLFAALGKSLVLDRFSCAPSLALTTESGAAKHQKTIQNLFTSVSEPVAFKSNVLGLKVEHIRSGSTATDSGGNIPYGYYSDMKITFPNYMTAYLQVLACIQSAGALTAGGNLRIPTNYTEGLGVDGAGESATIQGAANPRGGVTLTDTLVPAREGDQHAQSDGLIGFGPVQGPGSSSASTGASTLLQRFTLSVVPALNGEENSIILRMYTNAGSTTSWISQFVLEVQAINQFLPTTVNKMVEGVATNQTGDLKNGSVVI